MVVAPTGPDARVLTAEMVGRAGGLVRQSPAVTFDGLVRLLLGRVPRYATELESELVVSEVLAETPTGALRAAARLPGVVPALRTLLQQLGESGREPDEVDRILARWAASDPPAAALVGDLRLLAGAYRQMCGQFDLGESGGAGESARRPKDCGVERGAAPSGRSRSMVSRRSHRASALWSKSWRRGSRCWCRSPTTTRATSISVRRARSSGGALGLECGTLRCPTSHTAPRLSSISSATS